MADQVVFRRVHGRVVPIRGKASETAKGLGLVGAGAGVGYAAGKLAAGLTHMAANSENKARGLASKVTKFKDAGPLFQSAYENAVKTEGRQALRHAVMAQRLNKASKALRNKRGIQIASGALIGAGVNKILNQTRLKDHPDTKAAVAAGAGVAGGFAVRSGYLRGVGVRGISVFRQALRNAALKV